MRYSPKSAARILAALIALALVATSCGSDNTAQMKDAVDTYAKGVYSSYEVSLASAKKMDEAIDEFIANPSESSLASARQAWIEARDDYGPTEAFRFYGGPIDNEETGKEGLINAWPLDEVYIDYVVGNETGGIINDTATYPTINADLLIELNEAGGEANVSTGWHAIEFLLWGQDLDPNGPGDRQYTDYTDAPNADRRKEYLAITSDVLLVHLEELVDAWAPQADNYRKDFLALEPTEAMRLVITGIGELSRGELAGERMNVAYSERSQEDEHSCFSDNTTADIVGNALGIQMVLTGEYPGGVSGTSVLDVVEASDKDLATNLKTEMAEVVSTLRAIPAPFDQHVTPDISDDDPGRQSVLAGIVALENVTETIVSAATAMDITVNVT